MRWASRASTTLTETVSTVSTRSSSTDSVYCSSLLCQLVCFPYTESLSFVLHPRCRKRTVSAICIPSLLLIPAAIGIVCGIRLPAPGNSEYQSIALTNQALRARQNSFTKAAVEQQRLPSRMLSRSPGAATSRPAKAKMNLSQ